MHALLVLTIHVQFIIRLVPHAFSICLVIKEESKTECLTSVVWPNALRKALICDIKASAYYFKAVQ